jgi:phage-related protein
MGGAEGGVDPALLANYDAKLAAWEASRQKIIQELVPNLQSAIVGFNQFQSFIQGVIDLAQAVTPLVGAAVGPADNHIMELNQALSGVNQMGSAIQSILNQVPTLVRTVQGLLPQKA